MKQFTVKDFINYNNPCINCSENVAFKIFRGIEKLDILSMMGNYYDNYNPLNAILDGDCINVDLKISYNSYLKLKIFHKTNNFQTSNMWDLTNYLGENKLLLTTHCRRCQSQIKSNFLEFNLNKHFLLPISVSQEHLMISDDKNIYEIQSLYLEDKTYITVYNLNDRLNVLHNLEIPMLPLFKIKTKEKLVNKIKTYLIFS